MQHGASIDFNYPKEICSLKIFKVKTSSKKNISPVRSGSFRELVDPFYFITLNNNLGILGPVTLCTKWRTRTSRLTKNQHKRLSCIKCITPASGIGSCNIHARGPEGPTEKQQLKPSHLHTSKHHNKDHQQKHHSQKQWAQAKGRQRVSKFSMRSVIRFT